MLKKNRIKHKQNQQTRLERQGKTNQPVTKAWRRENENRPYDGDESRLHLFFSETTVKQRLFLFDIAGKTTSFSSHFRDDGDFKKDKPAKRFLKIVIAKEGKLV